MKCSLFLRMVAAAACLEACSAKQAVPFPYPAHVVGANEQQRYKTALWCSYTSCLDSSAFRVPLSDSLRRTLQDLLARPRLLETIEISAKATAFHFRLGPYDAALTRLYQNCARYGPPGGPPGGLRPVVGVWVNHRDSLVASVLNIYNLDLSPGPTVEQVHGKWQVTGQPTLREWSFNTDPPCKVAFLQANGNGLPDDLRLLCIEKGILQ